MRFEDKVFTDGDREFFFPSVKDDNLVVCAYLAATEDIGPRSRPVVFAHAGPLPKVPWADRYIAAPVEGIRHAAATGDPTMLLDWLLENACDTRPWLAEAIEAALAAGRAG